MATKNFILIYALDTRKCMSTNICTKGKGKHNCFRGGNNKQYIVSNYILVYIATIL